MVDRIFVYLILQHGKPDRQNQAAGACAARGGDRVAAVDAPAPRPLAGGVRHHGIRG